MIYNENDKVLHIDGKGQQMILSIIFAECLNQDDAKGLTDQKE